jgi:WD40 repeat protein
VSQCPNPNCLYQNLPNTKFCVKCCHKLSLSDRSSHKQGSLVKDASVGGNLTPAPVHLSDRPSQKQDNLVQGANVGRDLTFAPVQNIIETQIIQSSVEVVTQRELNKNSPYQGLKRFNFKDRERFFGRDKLIARLFGAVNRSNLSLVLGASGSGKSSVVRAGLIPELNKSLESQTFSDFIFTPNRDPFDSLYRCLLSEEKDYSFRTVEAEIALEAKAETLSKVINTLRKDGERWLIFVDQFEELFTICNDLDKRKKFISGLVQVAKSGNNSIKIVLAMRSDFLEQLSFYPDLGNIANQNNIHLVTEMYPDELRQAIEQPAAKHGVMFEKGLVEQIIQEVEGQKGYLPLLQYTLNLLWESECQSLGANGRPNIEDRTLNKKNYAALEGIRGALQKRVSEIYSNLNQDQQTTTKQIFLKLVNIVDHGYGRKAVSRRANRDEFVGKSVGKILNKFIEEKLLVSSGEYSSPEELQVNDSNDSKLLKQSATVEIAHEILISSWDELKGWLEEEKEVIILKNWLAGETRRWQKIRSKDKSKAQDELLKGSRLAQVVEFRQKDAFENVGGLRPEESEFIDASVAERDRLLHEEEARRKRKLIAVSLTSVGFAGLALLAGMQWQQAEQQRTILKLSEQAQEASNLLSINPVEGVVRTIATYGESKDKFGDRFAQILPQVRSSLRDAIAVSTERNVLKRNVLRGKQNPPVWSAAFSPDGQIIASAGNDGAVSLWDSKGNPIGKTFRSHRSKVRSVAFSPDGQYIVSGGDNGTVGLSDKQGNPIGKTFQSHQGIVQSVAFSPDGQYIASGGGNGTVGLWDLKGNPIGKTFLGHRGIVQSVAFSPDGQYIVSGSADNTIRLWDKQGNPIGKPFQGHHPQKRCCSVFSVAFSPDGKMIASGSADNTIRLWDLKGNVIGKPFTGNEDYVRSVTFSPDGKYILSGSDDKTIRLWDLKGNQIGQPLIGHEYYIYSVAFSPDGKYIVSSSEDGTVRLWNKADFLRDPSLVGHQSKVLSIAISPDGQYIASGSADLTIRLWDKHGDPVAMPLVGHRGDINSVAFSPDGQYIVSGSADKTIRLWDKQGNPIGKPLVGHEGAVNSVASSPNGEYIVSGSRDGTLRLWDKQGKAIGQPFSGHGGAVFSVAFSPDGQQIISGGNDKTIRLWDLKGGKIGKLWRGHKDEVHSVAFSPDGEYVVSGSRDRTIRLWDKQGKAIGQPFIGHGSAVTSVVFSPNGEYIVSGSRDRTIRLWDKQGKAIGQPLQRHESPVSSVVISPDGQLIVSGSWDLTVRLWQGSSFSTWLQLACDRLGEHSLLTMPATEEAKVANKTCANIK